jgi:hypothetical protein
MESRTSSRPPARRLPVPPITAAVPPGSFPQLSTAGWTSECGRTLVPSHDHLQEIFGRRVRQFPHAEIVDDEQRGRDEIRQVVLRRVPSSVASASSFEQHVSFTIPNAIALVNDGAADRLEGRKRSCVEVYVGRHGGATRIARSPSPPSDRRRSPDRASHAR